ncbi:MAG: toxin [Cyanobacteria bacterium P01_H01_bin.152]
MKSLQWDLDKNSLLKATRGIDFDTVALAIHQGRILDIIEHPNQEKYPSQKIFVLAINQYIYLVPFVESEQVLFLKTIIPSRKMKKKYLGETDD